MLDRLPEVSPRTYRRIALFALAAFSLIVMTGAAVRVTGSGLGCPDWPRCYGKAVAPLEVHALIEYGNRLLTSLVVFAAGAAVVGGLRRRPYRRELVLLGWALVAGVVAQVILGGFTVENQLAPGYVMAHFGLSMLILIVAVALAWRATFEPGAEPRSTDGRLVWAVRALVPLGALAVFAGTVATAAGPHAGAHGEVPVHRLRIEGAGTLDWAIHWHARIAALLGVAAFLVWVLARQREAGPELRRASTWLVALLGAQGVVGAVQYELHLPAAIVWVHVVLASLTWVAVLWAAAAAGRLRTVDAVESSAPEDRTAPPALTVR